MINPDSNRLNYSESIIPPKGYSLEAAICTTYSLDLESLIAITMALGFSIDTPQKEKENKALMLKALRDISNKLIIFCESGQIKIPNLTNSLYILLEKMIVPISLKKQDDFYPAFHPKTWLLEYKNQENNSKIYRFFILSRNLTFDKSWDISLLLEGQLTSTIQNKTKPLISFYSFLNDEVKKQNCINQTIVNNILTNLSKVKFNLDCKDYTDYNFVPIGVSDSYGMKNEKIFNLRKNEKFDNLLIMSPFLSTKILNYFCTHLSEKKKDNFTKNLLFTRRSALEKITKSQEKYFNIYALKEYFDDIEDDGSFVTEKNDNDLHAKIFITKLNNNVDLYLGSMNATTAARDNNVEMMIHLKVNNTNLNAFERDLLSYKERKNKDGTIERIPNYFELIHTKEEKNSNTEKDEDDMKQIIKTICRLNLRAKILKEENKIDIFIDHTIKENDLLKLNYEEYDIHISPINNSKNNKLFKLLENDNEKAELTFENIEDISEFYIISVRKGNISVSGIIKIQTINMPENREEELLKSVFSDSNTLLEYLKILFSDNSQNIYDTISSNKKQGLSMNYISSDSTAFYEMMLRSALYNKEVMNEFNSIVSKLPEKNEVTKKINALYKLFNQAMEV